MEPEQRVDQRGLARAVRAQKSDGSPSERAPQLFEDWTSAEADAQSVEFDDRTHRDGAAILVSGR